jgi:Tol biopolymer transport system component
MRQWMSALFLCLLLLSCAQPRPQPAADEHRITRGAGEARTPVLSRDGSTVAFAAVAPGYKNPQIWVMRADGAAPARPLTNDAAQNYDPEFSPDGRTIYFTSTREPQGIYRVPSAGGDAEMAIPNGYAARISPDGRTILYGSAGRVVKRPLAGGEPLAVLAALDNSFAPLWSPDSRRILVTTTTPPQREPEWWIVPAQGGEPVKTALGTDLRAQGFNYIALRATRRAITARPLPRESWYSHVPRSA